MPVIGYFIGYSFKDILEAYIPWIAFSLLTLLAIKSFVEWIIERKKKEEIKEKHISIIDIFIQAISTSIDALCIGFVYLYLDVYWALIVFAIIGVTTFVLSILTSFLAHLIAKKLEKWAGLIASLVFFALGLKILIVSERCYYENYY